MVPVLVSAVEDLDERGVISGPTGPGCFDLSIDCGGGCSPAIPTFLSPGFPSPPPPPRLCSGGVGGSGSATWGSAVFGEAYDVATDLGGSFTSPTLLLALYTTTACPGSGPCGKAPETTDTFPPAWVIFCCRATAS